MDRVRIGCIVAPMTTQEVTVRLVHPSIPVRTYDVIVRSPGFYAWEEDMDAGDALDFLILECRVPFDTAVSMLMDANYGLTEEELEECDLERRTLAGFVR